MIRARPEVEAMTPYVAPLEGRRSLLRLDFNESTVGPSPAVVEAIRGLLPDAYGTYPEYAGLNDAYAATLGVPASHVEAFNGVDAAIRAIFDAYGERGGTFLTTVPTFGYYAPCAQQQGMVIDEILYPKDLSFPLEAVTRRLEARPRLCFICNPNNPTGTLLAPHAITALARSSPVTLVVVDELYVAFTGQSILPAALELPNVLALQSLSKAAGIAALRLGFAVGHPTIVERLRRVTGPYDINMFAVVAGKAALADPDHMRQYVVEVLAARAWTIDELRGLGVRYAGDGGNYVLVWPPGDCEDVVGALRDEGILVRSMAGKPVIDGSFRLTIGTRQDMRRFMTAFASAINPPGSGAASGSPAWARRRRAGPSPPHP
ncbi:MAG: histidinol-phosphate aminotransferase [Cyanobacteria bacterium 13_1_40CM_2_61_4]|nr:MAG: histidinol-phosphate aminotransferase [Cyanobacteria bacterium 13_1_40CM_2_61_4]